LGDSATKFALAKGNAAVLAAGFSCQPFSSLGDQAGLQDDRGQIILDIMDTARLGFIPSIVLENVANVEHNLQLQRLLAAGMELLGMRGTQVVLDNVDKGFAKRRRWWSAYSVVELPCPMVQCWAKEPHRAAQFIVRNWGGRLAGGVRRSGSDG
jgi:hypothetical protein